MAGLPKIGVEVVAVGVATFNRNMNDIMRSIVNVRRTTNALEQAGANSFGTFGAAASGAALIVGAAGVTITAALTAVTTKATEMAAQFEQTMAVTGAIAEASASDMTNMASAAVAMSRRTTVSLNNIAEAMAELARAGLNMEDILGGATQAVLDLVVASGGELGLERAVLMVGGAINAFSLSGKDAATVANAMSVAALKSAISFADVQRSMQQASASAAMLGFTVQDTAAAIGILGLANIRGSDAGTSLKQMFLSLMAPSKQAVDMMRAYNIALFNGEERALTFRTLVGRLSTAFSDEAIAAGKVTEAERAQALATIFGSDAIRAAIMLARFGTGVYDKFIDTMDRLSAAELAAKILRPTTAQFGILKNQVVGLTTVFGTDLNLALGKAGRTLNFFVRQIDADVVKEFGRAFVAAMTGSDELIKLPQKLKESPFADVFISWVQLARGLHQALITRVVPAFINLFQVITGGQPITSLLATLMTKVTTVINTGSKYLAYFINGVAAVIKLMNSWTVTASALKVVLSGLILLPFLGFINIILRMLAPFLALSGTAIAAAAAIYLIPKALTYLTTELQDSNSQLNKYLAQALGYFKYVAIAAGVYAAFLTYTVGASTVAYLKNLAVAIAATFTAMHVGAKGPFARALVLMVTPLIIVGKLIWTSLIPAFGAAIKNVARLGWALGTYLVTGIYRAIEAFILLGVQGGIAFLRLTLVGRAATAAVVGLKLLAVSILSVGVAIGSAVVRGVTAFQNLVYSSLLTGGVVNKVFTGMFTGVSAAVTGMGKALIWFAIAVAKAPQVLVQTLLFSQAIVKLYAQVFWASMISSAKAIGVFIRSLSVLPKALVLASVGFFQTAKNATISAATTTKAWVLNVPKALWSAAKAVASAMAGMVVSFYNTARAAVLSAGTTARAFITTTIPAIIAGARAAIVALGQMALGFVRMAAAAVAAAITTRVAFITTIVGAVITAAGFVITTLLPIIALVALVGGAVYLLAKAFIENFDSIKKIVKQVVDFVADKLKALFDFLSSLPIVGDIFKSVGDGIRSIADTVGGELPKAIETAKSAWESLKNTAMPVIEGIASEAQKALPSIMELLGISMPDQAKWDEDLKKNEAELEKLRKEYEDLTSTFPEVGSAAAGAGDELKKLTLVIGNLLRTIPAMNIEVAEFIAGLVEIEPSRMASLITTLRSAHNILQQMVAAKQALLQTGLLIEQSEIRISMLEARMNLAQMQYQRDILAFEQQILALRMQAAIIDAAILPLRTRAAAIDREIALLQRESVELTRERLEIQAAMLPIQQQIAAIDRAIAATQRENYALAIQRANIELEAMPARRELQLIERQIADIGDKRLDLAMREKQLVAEGALAQMEKDLKATNNALDEAWANQNVDEIIRLEALKAQQEKAVADKQSAVDEIRNEQAEISRRNELAKIGLEYEKLALEEIILAMDRKIEDINYENDLQQKRQEIIRLGLEKEKQALEDILAPMKLRIELINEAIERQRIQNALIIFNLEQEKQGLEDIIYGLELQKAAIDNIIAALELQMQQRELEYRQSIQQYEIQIANEKILRAELELTRLQQEEALTSLNLAFVALMTASGAYTAAEALEVSKRLGLWSDQMQAMSAIITEFSNLIDATLNFSRALASIERQIDINIVTHYSSTGTPSSSTSSTGNPGSTGPEGGMQHGGIVPGRWGDPIWILAHGGERFLGINNTKPASTYNAGATRIAPVQQNTYNTSYNVNASYSRTQSAASIGMDLRAMVGMTRR